MELNNCDIESQITNIRQIIESSESSICETATDIPSNSNSTVASPSFSVPSFFTKGYKHECNCAERLNMKIKELRQEVESIKSLMGFQI